MAMTLDKYLIKKSKSNELVVKSTVIENFTLEDQDHKHEDTENNNIDVNTEELENLNSDEEINENEVPSKKRKLYKEQFKFHWKEKYTWLINRNGSYCKICEKSLTGGYSHIKRHAETTFHKRRQQSNNNTAPIEKLLCNNNNNVQPSAELKLVMFIAEHNLPIRILEHLPKFIRNICPDSEIAKNLKCGRTKGTNIICKKTGPENLKNICDILKKKKYSLIIDETTDVSTSKCLALVARFYDNESRNINDKFLGIIDVEDRCSSNGIFNSIASFFEKNEIPFQNMIGFAADNCSVMMGNKNGVKIKFQEKIPNLFILGCICHSMNLCSSHACEKLPSTIIELYRTI